MTIVLSQYGPTIAGLLLALAVWIMRRRSHTALPASTRIRTATVMVFALAGMTAFTVWSVFPTWMPPLGENQFLLVVLARYLVPLLLCALALLALLPPLRSSRPQDNAHRPPGRMTSVAPRPELVVAAAVAGAVIVASVIAGLLSSPDELGRYVLYDLDFSNATRGSTTVYGWWFSLPGLAVIAVIAAMVLTVLVTARRSPQTDIDRNDVLATTRVRTVLAVGTGGLLLHLSAILQSLYGTSTLHIGFSSGSDGRVETGTPFAALGPAFLTTSYIVVVLGFALWWGVLLAALLPRMRRPGSAVTARPHESHTA